MSDPLFPAPDRLPPKAKPPVPKEVNIAFGVWVLTALAGSVLQLLNLDPLVKVYQQQLASSGQVDVLSDGDLRTAAIIGIVAAGLLGLLFAWKMRAGRNWARILLAVPAVFGLMLQASSVGFSDVLTLAEVLVTATGLVFMFVPQSNAYFRQFRRPPVVRR